MGIAVLLAQSFAMHIISTMAFSRQMAKKLVGCNEGLSGMMLAVRLRLPRIPHKRSPYRTQSQRLTATAVSLGIVLKQSLA